jgi:excisionase family DNA binding protein
MRRASFVAAGVFVPADLLPGVARGLELLRAELRRAGVPLPAELDELARIAEAATTTMRQRHLALPTQFPGGSGPERGDFRPIPPQSPPSDTMSAVDVAALLQRSERRVRQLAQKGELPALRSPEGWIFNRKDVTEWLKQQRSGSNGRSPAT